MELLSRPTRNALTRAESFKKNPYIEYQTKVAELQQAVEMATEKILDKRKFLEEINLRNVKKDDERESVRLERGILQARIANCDKEIEREKLDFELKLKILEIKKVKKEIKLLHKITRDQRLYFAEPPYLAHVYELVINYGSLTKDNRKNLEEKIMNSLSKELKTKDSKSIMSEAIEFVKNHYNEAEKRQSIPIIKNYLSRLPKPTQSVYAQIAIPSRAQLSASK